MICAEFFDVKFYPYNPVGADPIFAAVSKKHVCAVSCLSLIFVNTCT